ncbi:SLC13 family permease [Calderihabitans maritimus]|uniref:Sodium-dependent dicarboxylate transporter SdcS n=1 Tax=Calderihabitans maritimus TaxID=1246530 RepID=A0A1Z5HR13_9FIRM|nr:SLC13 family permease [Calderihabitans maritimus]GAW91745.1 sodium/sulfate symporter [Calderihabitans maritimus]
MSTEIVSVKKQEVFDLDKKKLLSLIIAFVIMLGLHFAPELPGLSSQGQSVLAVFLWFMIVMISGSLHRFVVGFAAPLFITILTDFKVAEAFSAFTGKAFFLAIGAFVYAGIMVATPLGKRIAIGITDLFRSIRVPRILLGLCVADFCISGFLPTVAETGLLLPLAKGFSGLTRGKEHLPEVKRINNGLFLLVCGLMPLFTSLLILTAHFPNILMAGFMEKAGITITWMDWLKLNLPLWGLMPVAYFYTIWYFKLWKVEIPGANEELPRMKKELGKITWPEKWALMSLGICLFLWITEKSLHNINTGMVAILLVFLVFLPFGKIKFETIAPHIMWDVWILLGGAISLGTALYKSGAVKWMVDLILSPMESKIIGLPPILILLIVVIGTQIARAGIVSAAAMGAMFIPLTMAMAPELGFNVLPFTLIVVNCLSYSFFLPMSITAFFIAWGASDMSMGEVIKFGTPLSIICNLYVIISLSIWLPIIGYPLTI